MITVQDVIKKMELDIEERALVQEAKDKLIIAEIEKIQIRKKAEEW